MEYVRKGVGVFALAMLMAVVASLTGAPHAFGTPELTVAYPPGECLTAPRSLDDVMTLVKGVEAAPDDGYPVNFIEELPKGEPADTETVDAITDVVVEATACARDNDLLRLLALYTDAYVVAIAASQPTLIENLWATPVSDLPVNPDLHVASIQDVMLLDHGRVSAIVTLGGVDDSHPAPGRTVLMIFAEQDRRWLLDGQDERVWSGDSTTTPVYIADVVATPVAPVATPGT